MSRIALTLTLTVAALAAILAVAGCATAPTAPVAVADGPEQCRDVVLPGQTESVNMCGTPAQWAEYDQRTAVFQPGVSCRDMLGYRSNTVSTVCATDADWAEYDRGESTAALREVRRFQGGSYDH